VATDNNGLSSTSSVVNITVTNPPALAVLQSIKTVFVIAMENHDLVQKNPTGSPQQILGNPAAPYFNSLITPGNSNAVQTAWATHMFSVAINGEHPSEPNYVWQEAGTDFGVRTDNDPGNGNTYTNVQHLSGQLTAAGIPWRSYQEDLEFTPSEEISKSGVTNFVNPYNGTTEYNYGVKHNPMAFFTDTQNRNCFPFTNFWTDLTNNGIGRYNWITPDQYNEWHSSLSAGYTYQGVHYTGDQAAIAEGDNCLSIILPKIMASQAYQDHGVIIIWTDETESTDDTNTTLPYVIISPLAKGNAYASTLPYSHATDLKTMDEIFGLAYQTNAIPAAYLDAQNTGYNYVDGRSATIYDLSDFFQGVGTDAPTLSMQQSGTSITNSGNAMAFGEINIGATASETFTVTNTGNAALVLSNVVIMGANAGDFTVSGLTLPTTVQVGNNATFTVTFAPTTGTAETAALQISDNDANNNPFTVNLTGTGVFVPPTVSLTGPANGGNYAAPLMLPLSVTTSDPDGTVTNVSYYQGSTLLQSSGSAPFGVTTANLFAGSYALTAVATDNNGLSSTSSVVNITVTNPPALAVLQSIKTVFVIAMENHDLVQKNPTGSPQQILGNPAAPYFNSLITPGNSNAVQTAWATHMFSVAINGEHPSEPNYVWQEAGTDFGIRTDNDPSASSHNIFTNVIHLSAQLTGAGIPWRTYQEDVQLGAGPTHSASGANGPVNIYNGTTDYNYAVKHNPMEFFPDTQNLNCYPLSQFWLDLTNNGIGRYNWITPDQYNEWHSSLPSGYTYKGVAYTGDQAAIAEGDNCLSIIIPQIMATPAYQNGGVIIIWTDETESTDDTNTTLPYVIISPLAKGNAYASTLPYSHASDLKTMDEIFQLAYQTNAIPLAYNGAPYLDAQNTGTNYVDGRSATIYDLSDFFQGVGTDAPALTVQQSGSSLTNGATAASFGSVNFGANDAETFTVTNTGNAALVLSNVVVTGANAGDFTVSGLTLPATLQVGNSATFTVTFAPTTGAAEVAALQISDNDSNNNPFTVSLTVTGVFVPPTVTIASPTNTESYIPGSAITVVVNATDVDSTISNVGLFVDGSLAYTFTSPPYILPIPGGELPAGTYTIQAKATDANGLTGVSAVATITNSFVAPTVSLTSPTSGSFYSTFATIPLAAAAASADGVVTNVAFYQGSTLLANVTSAPFSYAWLNNYAGSYSFTAVAKDSHGLTNISSVVTVTVTNGFGVGITSPVNNAQIAAGTNLVLTANAVEAGGAIANVEFFANGTDLGGAASAPYSITWSNVPASTYALTAVATDASSLTVTSLVVNITVAVAHVPPAVALTVPTNGAAINVARGLLLTATASSSDGTVTNLAFYQNSFFVANVATAPYKYLWTNAPSGIYTLTAVATDNTGASSVSSAVSITASNSTQIATIQQIKTIFVIAMENHDLVQKNPTGSPQQILGNPAAPYFNSLITPGNSNAVQTAWATHMFSTAINGEHPSEPNYVWQEAGTDFGVRTDNDPGNGNTYTNVQHLSAQLTAAGIPWRTYQEDVQYSSSEEVSASGSGVPVNPYNGTAEYNYGVKHNPMAFFTDTQNKNCYALTNFWTDLTNNNIGRYNWITPDQYNEWHSSLPGGYTYNGVAYTGDQAAIAEGDNALSIIIPKIMASQAYQNGGAIIIWTDETESTDDTNTTLPYVIISPLSKGNAYASTLPYSHSSDLKTMDELFGLAYQTNAIPASYLDAQNTSYNDVNGSSAVIYDLSDFFVAPPAVQITGTTTQNGANFQLTFTGPQAQTYEVLATTDLTLPQSAWTVVASGTFNGTSVVYTDTNSANTPARYFVVKAP